MVKSKLDFNDNDIFNDDLIKPKKKGSKNELKDFDDFDNFNDELDRFDDSFNTGFNVDGQIAIEKHNDLLKELTSFSPYLRAIVNNWLGVVWDEKKKKYTSNPEIEPIMNIKGVTWCVGRLGTYTRKNNIITYIRSEDYKHIMLDFISEIWLNIITKKKEFGITNNGDVIRICNELQHAAELVLMGAGQGKYTDFLGSSTSYAYSGKVNPDEFSNTEIKTKSNKVRRFFGI